MKRKKAQKSTAKPKFTPFPVNKPRKSIGRPPALDERLRTAAIKLAEMGFTDTRIAQVLQVTMKTLASYRQDPDFYQKMTEAKHKTDDRVVSSLYERAIGYTYPKEEIISDKTTGAINRVITLVHIPPDVQAIKFWLCNRQRDKWKPEFGLKQEITNNTQTNIITQNKVQEAEVTDEHRRRLENNLGILRRHGMLASESVEN